MTTPKIDKDSATGFLKKYWWALTLIIIVASAFYLRSLPARFGELQALDPFYLYRMSEAVVEGNVAALEQDMLRYQPEGINFWATEFVLPVYMPAYSYMVLSAIGMNMHFLDFAILWPALMGAVAVLVSYFVGKELFHSKFAGLFTAFFMATTPAFLTRTSAGFFEKEPIAGPFIMLSVLFFARAFKKGSWLDGVMAGVSLTGIALSWGGAVYMYMLFGGFLLFLFLANSGLVVLNYLFGGLEDIMNKMEPFFSFQMIKAYVPMVLVSIGLSYVASFFSRIVIESSFVWISLFSLALLLGRFAIDKYSLVSKPNLQYVVPGILAFGLMFMVVGSMFSDVMWNQMNSITGLLTGTGGAVVTTTVAENAPGSWDNVYSMLGNSFANNMIPEFAGYNTYFALWLFMFLGIGAALFRFIKTHNWLMILPVFWGASTIWGIFYRVRLAFLLGPPAAVLGGFFCAWVVEKAYKAVKDQHITMVTKHSIAAFFSVIAGFAMLVLYRNVFGLASFVILSVLAVFALMFHMNRNLKIDIKSTMPLLAAAFIAFVVSINFINSSVYASSIGPSICFARGPDDKCLTISETGEISLNLEQPWYQAMNYFATETPEDSIILSWWDFGYWFQTRGERPSVVDGGHLGGMRDIEIATWYTDSSDKWDEYLPWMEGYGVDYILMDYTLPGKYGAISKIASEGSQILGFLEFQQSGMVPKDNTTVYTFVAGPYELWLPLDENGALIFGSPPMFLVRQGDQYSSRAYINDVCTTQGIIHVGDGEPSMGGCVTMGSTGFFYIPEEAKESNFVNLQFMDGYGLEGIGKVFDNTLVRIYKVTYPGEVEEEPQEVSNPFENIEIPLNAAI